MLELMGRRTLSTTELSRRLGVKIDAKFMREELRIPPDVITGNGNFWFESKFEFICHELAQYFYGISRGSYDDK